MVISDIVLFLKEYGIGVAVFLVLLYVLARYLTYPWVTKVAKATHKLFFLVDKMYEAETHPTKIDPKGYPILLARRELLSSLEQIIAILHEIKSLKNTIEARMCSEACPAFAKIGESLQQMIGHEKETLDKILELRKETGARVDDGYDRINEFLETLLADRNAQISEMNAMLLRVAVAMEEQAKRSFPLSSGSHAGA